MKLLDTTGGNTKLRKANKDVTVRIAGLSMLPDDVLCPMRWIAECADPCLRFSGRGIFDNVERARLAKTEYFHANRPEFIERLSHEIHNFKRTCIKKDVLPYVRLNVFSDVQWEKKTNGSFPQQFPDVEFLDYTKIAKRLDKTPVNYDLMFSWSNAPKYKEQVDAALKTTRPMSVVFYGPMPKEFLGREVIDGDQSDIYNVKQFNKIVGLKYKVAKGQDIDPTKSNFIVCT